MINLLHQYLVEILLNVPSDHLLRFYHAFIEDITVTGFQNALWNIIMGLKNIPTKLYPKFGKDQKYGGIFQEIFLEFI